MAIRRLFAGSRAESIVSLAANLRYFRRTVAGLSQETLASKSGVSRAVIARIERGAIDTSLSTLLALCDSLGISIVLLLMTARERRAMKALLGGSNPIEQLGLVFVTGYLPSAKKK
jgi:transcriptional regulator with XRE-family HTH domain